MIVAPPPDVIRTVPPGGSEAEAEVERTLLGFVLRGKLLGVDPQLFYSPALKAIADWSVKQRQGGRPADAASALRKWSKQKDLVNSCVGFAKSTDDPATHYLQLVQDAYHLRHEWTQIARRQEAIATRKAKPKGEGGEFKLELRPADQLEEATTDWLWYPYLPRGELVVLAGMPGTGKSNLSRWLAAMVSTGCDLAARTETTEDWLESPYPERVDFVCAEDHPTKVVVPRLRIQGADLSMIRIVSHPKDLPITSLHLEGLERAWEEEGPPALLVLDPASSMIPTGVDANAQSDVKQSVTGPLSRMAARWNVSVLLVTHVAKRAPASGAHVLTWIHGSIEWSAGARAALVALRHQHDQNDKVVRVFTAKQNLGPEGPAFAYEVEGRGRHCEVVWRGLTEDTPAKLTKKDTDKEPSKVEVAVDWLHSYLAEKGPTKPSEARLEGMRQGHSKWSIQQARETLDVVSTGHKRTARWSLPEDGGPDA